MEAVVWRTGAHSKMKILSCPTIAGTRSHTIRTGTLCHHLDGKNYLGQTGRAPNLLSSLVIKEGSEEYTAKFLSSKSSHQQRTLGRQCIVCVIVTGCEVDTEPGWVSLLIYAHLPTVASTSEKILTVKLVNVFLLSIFVPHAWVWNLTQEQ